MTMFGRQCLSTFLVRSRGLHTSRPAPAIPPVMWLLLKPLSRVAAGLLGKGARVWWRRLPDTRKMEFKEWARGHRRKFVYAGGLFSGGILYAYESHIQECPITGKKRFVALYPDQVKKLSKQEFQNNLKEFEDNIVSSDSKIYNRVVNVLNKLLKGNRDIRQIYDKSWTVTVVDSSIRNAFVLPCGNIFVFKGMLDICRNDDQLAIIIGHEMSHAILGHVAEQLTQAGFISMLLLVPMAVIWAMLPNDGIALVTSWFIQKATDICFSLPHSRRHEMEADEVGLMMAAKACFDVREAPALWEIMEVIDSLNEDLMSTDKDLEFLSSHPVHSSRCESLSELLSPALKIRLECGCARLDPDYDPQTFVHYIKEEKRKYLALETLDE